MRDSVVDEIRRIEASNDRRSEIPRNVVVIRMFGNPREPTAMSGTVWDFVEGPSGLWGGSPAVAAYRDGERWCVVGDVTPDDLVSVCSTDAAASDVWLRSEIHRQLERAFPGRAPQIGGVPSPLPTQAALVAALSPDRTPEEVEGWLTATRLNRVGAPGGALWWLSIPEAAISCLEPPDAAIRVGLVLRDPRRPHQGWPEISLPSVARDREAYDDLVAAFADDPTRQRLMAEEHLRSYWWSAEELVRLTAGWMRMEAAAEGREPSLLAEVLERAVNEGRSDAEDPRRVRSARPSEWQAAADGVDEALCAEAGVMDRVRRSHAVPSGELLRDVEAVAVELLRRVRTLSELIGLVLTSPR